MVLRDLPTGAMRHLNYFLTETRGRGGRFREDFAPMCLPITAGIVGGHLSNFVTPAAH
jgi:peptidoglycan-N-acetylglucosamine deacetylase